MLGYVEGRSECDRHMEMKSSASYATTLSARHGGYGEQIVLFFGFLSASCLTLLQ